jgi:hypothetical protein
MEESVIEEIQGRRRRGKRRKKLPDYLEETKR